jgi:hypothetical protein
LPRFTKHPLDYYCLQAVTLEKNASGMSSRRQEFTTRSPASQSSELEFLPYCCLTLVAPFRDDFLDEEELRPAATVARLFKRVTLVVGHSVASCGRPTRFGRRRRIPGSNAGRTWRATSSLILQHSGWCDLVYKKNHTASR